MKHMNNIKYNILHLLVPSTIIISPRLRRPKDTKQRTLYLKTESNSKPREYIFCVKKLLKINACIL